ncbi:membrane protein ORF83 [Cyprinid herpesvirus 1]|uniref:Membrane protein ORF83 n=1 Tax=Cyprinid herpesvirus 1 TaxID=317858 RepID=K7PCK8_9VIRU|nr:membrane protein ORF83 [Cyprinid herpesvirus 1]AFJ20380.1 membrane protein ORF83 [Cyprinid herpesvirus 1]
MSPLCGLIKFLIRFILDMLVAGVGVYIATSCLYDRSMFRTCPNSVCWGHLSVWLTVCVIPTVLSGVRWTQQFIFWITTRAAKHRGQRTGKCCGTYREILLGDYRDEEEEEKVKVKESQKPPPPGPDSIVVRGMPDTSSSQTSFVLFGFVCFVSYIAWSVSTSACEWYIYIIPALVSWKIFSWLVGTCVSSYRYSQRHRDVEQLVNQTLSNRGYERI